MCGGFGQQIYSDEIYEHVFHVIAIWGSQVFPLQICCYFNIEPHCFQVYVRQCWLQTLAAICKNMGFCGVFTFSRCVHQGKYIFTRENLSFNEKPAMAKVILWFGNYLKQLFEPMMSSFADTYMCHSISYRGFFTMTSHKRHVVSNHQLYDCLFKSLCGPTSNKHQSPHCWPLWGNPAPQASDAGKASISWRHPGI